LIIGVRTTFTPVGRIWQRFAIYPGIGTVLGVDLNDLGSYGRADDGEGEEAEGNEGNGVDDAKLKVTLGALHVFSVGTT
jgi:hypothetical protein